MAKDQEIIETKLSPSEILHDPLMNKGTAFTFQEREQLGLLGMLPYHESTIEEQVQRRYSNFTSKRTSMGKYKMLSSLQDRNEILFYRLIVEHVSEMLPYIYTPTVGEASLGFSLNYDQPRGIYLSYEQLDKIDSILNNIPKNDVEVIVVTDGSRILGLGDMGTGGMVIPVGKLVLYTVFGGIDPRKVLPVMLDMGTDNPELLGDPLYLGWRHPRIKGEDYFRFVEQFIAKIKNRYPNVLLQWEDFSKETAKDLLDRYQKRILSFNDDIQGTAATVLAGLLAALKTKKEKLSEQKILMVGGGSAGMGIVHLLTKALLMEGLSETQAKKCIYIIDRPGLVHKGISKFNLGHESYARTLAEIDQWKIKDKDHITLYETIENAHPTILIGACAQPNIFTEPMIRQMAKYCEKPIIFPLSNPTSKSEAEPKNIISWTNGRALIATGSPFPPFLFNSKEYRISQGNNVYIFPGIGLAAVATKATEITDEMFIKAADILSSEACKMRSEDTVLFPPFESLRDVSKKIAVSVGEFILEKGYSKLPPDSNVRDLVDKTMWYPDYPIYVRAASKPE